MNIRSLPQTAKVRAALANIQRYVQSLPTPPPRVVLSRSVYQELSAAAKGEPIDIDGIPLESR